MDTSTFWDEKSTIGLHTAVKFERDSCGSTDAASSRICKEERSLFQYCDGNLNFATVASEDDEYSYNNKKKGILGLSRDPMSHRIIEKRRRDRMNNCLADLSRLIPADYLKKGRGRIEKTEIIEMAIKHMKHLQTQGSISKTDSSDASQPPSQDESVDLTAASSRGNYSPTAASTASASEQYRLGYQECATDVMHFVVEVEGFFAGDALCMELIRHLQKHCDTIINGDRIIYPRTHANHVNHVNHINHETASNSSGSVTSSPHHNKNNNNNHHNTASLALGSPDPGESSSDFNARENQRKPNKSETASESNNHADHTTSQQQSQLRDMLTGQHITSNNQTTKRNHIENAVHDPTLYKFKNNIKQRFSAEHDKRRRFEMPVLKRRNSDTCSVLSSLPSPDLRHSPPPKTYGVPIFALHSKGSYYVPLTLDSETLSPFFNELNAETSDDEVGQILHPVTISVNFPQSHSRYARLNIAEGSVWSEDADRLTSSRPTWHQCEGSPSAVYNKRL